MILNFAFWKEQGANAQYFFQSGHVNSYPSSKNDVTSAINASDISSKGGADLVKIISKMITQLSFIFVQVPPGTTSWDGITSVAYYLSYTPVSPPTTGGNFAIYRNSDTALMASGTLFSGQSPGEIDINMSLNVFIYA